MENESMQSAVNQQETAAQSAVNQQKTAAPDRSERVKADLDEFARIFPDAYHRASSDISSMPEKVWEGVRGGLSLAASYAKYGMDSGRNASRSTGSMRSAGQEFKSSDPFLEGWGD